MVASSTCLSFEGFEASIEIEGNPLKVYGSSEVKGRKLNGYIATQEGCNFEVVIKRVQNKNQPDRDVVILLDIDGEKAGAVLLTRESTYEFQGKFVGNASISKFLFMKLQTTDDEELACGDEAFIKGLGSISLRVCRISAMGKSVPVPASGSKLGVATKLIDEKSKKGKISHQTGYGASETCAPTSNCQVTYIDRPEHPFCELVFIYRSQALLEINKIVPMSNGEYYSEDAVPVHDPIVPTKKRTSTAGCIELDDDGEVVVLVKEEKTVKKVKKEVVAVAQQKKRVVVVIDSDSD